MKNFFTLIAVAAMALTASAQGKYAMAEGEAPDFGASITSVSNCTMTFGDGTGTAAFQAAVAPDVEVTGYGYYTKGNGVNGNKPGGTVYVFKPTIAGTLTVAVVLNADKAFHISEDGTDLADYAGITVADKYHGTYSFPVKANSTYKVWCDGSKLGFFGFELSTGSAVEAVAEAKAEKAAPVKVITANGVQIGNYNIAGQQVK